MTDNLAWGPRYHSRPTVIPELLAAAAAKSLQSCPTLWDPIDSSPPDSSIPGILQARTLEWVAISFYNAWKWKVKVKSLSRVQLCNSLDCSLPGSSTHGIFQARVLEWVAIAFSAWIAYCDFYSGPNWFFKLVSPLWKKQCFIGLPWWLRW